MTVTQDVFELVLARPIALTRGEHASMVHIWWRAPQQGDRLVQIYVDQELFFVACDVSQRECVLFLDRTCDHHIELLAVDCDHALSAQPQSLTGWNLPIIENAAISIVRDHALPIHASLRTSLNGMNHDEALLFPANEPRGGFGALFGEGGFGYDDAAGFGLGRGELGLGPLGEDGTAWQMNISCMNDGLHDLDIDLLNEKGGIIGEADDIEVQLNALPAPASMVYADESMTLKWK